MPRESLEKHLYDATGIIFTTALGGYSQEVVERVQDFSSIFDQRHDELKDGKVMVKMGWGYGTVHMMSPEEYRQRSMFEGVNDLAPGEPSYDYLDESPYGEDEIKAAIVAEKKYSAFIKEIRNLIANSYDELYEEAKQIVWLETEGMIRQSIHSARLDALVKLFNEFADLYEFGHYADIPDSYTMQLVEEMNDFNSGMQMISSFDVSGQKELEFMYSRLEGRDMVGDVVFFDQVIYNFYPDDQSH